MTASLNAQETTEATPILNVTPAAASKIKELLEARGLQDYSLRVFVSGGGCSGLQYGMAFEKEADESDTRVDTQGVSLLVDSMSLEYLHGAYIDFVDNLMGGGFRIDNPNATSSCGCGHSFRTADSSSSGSGCGGCH